MDYKEAIEILQTLYPFKCKMVDGRLKGGFRDYNCDTGKAITFAISAMQELQMYKAGKLVLIPDATHKKQCEELDEYKKLGTLEEVREAVERQKEKQVINIGKGDILRFGTCPICNRRISNVEGGNYCQNCGQKLNWTEVEE